MRQYINENTERSQYRLVIAALVILVRMCVGIIWASAGPLLPLIMQEYGTSRSTVSWYASIVSIVMVTLIVPIGIIGRKTRVKRLFAVGAFLQSAGIIAPFCSNFALLILTRALFGLGIAITIPVAAAIIVQWFDARELPLVNGLIMTFVNLGNAISLAATIPITKALYWRAPLALYGGIAFIVASSWLLLGKEQQAITLNDPNSDSKLPMTIGSVLKKKTTLLLAFSLVGPFCLSTAISSWLPTYYHEAFGMPLAKASSITALIALTGTIACLFGGILPMRIGLRRPFLVVSGLLTGLAALGCFMFNNLVIILISVLLFGVFSSLALPSIFTIPMELPDVTPRLGTVALALTLAAGNFGAFMGPLIVGYLADWTGSYLPGFVACSVLSFSLFIGGLLLPETGPRAKQRPSQL